MCLHSGVDASTARQALALTIALMEAKVAAGESVDLGFMNLKVTSTKPGAFIAPGTGGTASATTYMIGESKRWWPVIRKSWLRKFRPKWSRF